MIAAFLGVFPSPVKTGSIRVAFTDSSEMTWWIEVAQPITPERLGGMLQSMLTLATDPFAAIQAGVVTKEDYEEALAARDQARAERAKTNPERVM